MCVSSKPKYVAIIAKCVMSRHGKQNGMPPYCIRHLSRNNADALSLLSLHPFLLSLFSHFFHQSSLQTMLIKKIKSKIQDRKLSVGLQQEQRQCVQHQNAATMDDQPLVEEPKWHKKFSMYSFSSLALRKDRHQRKSSPFQHSLSMPQFSSVAEEAPQQSSELNHSLSVAVNAASGSVGGDSSSSSRETSSIPLAERRPSSITVQTTCTSSTNALRRPFSCSAVESISIPDILVALRNAVEEEVDAASITSSRVGDPGITCAHKHPQHQTRQTSSDGDSGEDSNNWRSSGCTVAVNHENIRSLLKMNMEEETLPANAGTVGANALENIPSEYHVDEKADETNEEQSNICLEKDRSATADDHIRNCSMHECELFYLIITYMQGILTANFLRQYRQSVS